MKLKDAAPRLGSRFPHLLVLEHGEETRLMLAKTAIEDARKDIEVLQALAHSLRTAAQWRERHSMMTSTRLSRQELLDMPVQSLTDAQLNKRLSYGGTIAQRKAGNAEKLRRLTASPKTDKEIPEKDEGFFAQAKLQRKLPADIDPEDRL